MSRTCKTSLQSTRNVVAKIYAKWLFGLGSVIFLSGTLWSQHYFIYWSTLINNIFHCTGSVMLWGLTAAIRLTTSLESSGTPTWMIQCSYCAPLLPLNFSHLYDCLLSLLFSASHSLSLSYRSVFQAALRRTQFYGFYSWLVLSVFGQDVIFLPSGTTVLIWETLCTNVFIILPAWMHQKHHQSCTRHTIMNSCKCYYLITLP